MFFFFHLLSPYRSRAPLFVEYSYTPRGLMYINGYLKNFPNELAILDLYYTWSEF